MSKFHNSVPKYIDLDYILYLQNAQNIKRMQSVSQQGVERVKQVLDVQQLQKDYDLPFELQGELV